MRQKKQRETSEQRRERIRRNHPGMEERADWTEILDWAYRCPEMMRLGRRPLKGVRVA